MASAGGPAILSAAKNLARTGTSAKILRCAQNDPPCQDFSARAHPAGPLFAGRIPMVSW